MENQIQINEQTEPQAINFDQHLDKNQLTLTNLYQIKQINSLVADSSITISLQSITSYYKDENFVVVGTTIGNILIIDSKFSKILGFQNLHNENEESFATYIGKGFENNEVIIGSNNGGIYKLNLLKNEVKRFNEAKNRQKITFIYLLKGQLIVVQDFNVVIIDLEFDTQLYIDIMQDFGKITQIQIDSPKNKLLLISTNKHNHFVYNLNSNILCNIGNKLPNPYSNFTGCAFYTPLQNFLFTQPQSVLLYVNNVTYQVEKAATIKNKKVKDLKLGNLYCINEECLVSINPEDSVALISLKQSRILTHQKLKSCQRSMFNEKQRIISIIGQNEEYQLVIYDFMVMSLYESFQELVESNNIKSAIKLVLKQKSLQDFDIIQQLLVKTFRKQQKPDLQESKDYKVFKELVNHLENEKKKQLTTQNEDDGFEQLQEDEGFGSLEEANEEFEPVSEAENQTNVSAQPESMSELLLRQRAIDLEKQRQKEQQQLAIRLYKENKKINRKLRRERFNMWFEMRFLFRLLFKSYQDNRQKLSQILADKQRPRKESVKLILKKNNYFTLIDIMEQFKFVGFPFAMRMIQFKYWELDIDHGLFSNAHVISRSYLRHIAFEIYSYLKIRRVMLKEKCGVELDQEENYWKNEFIRIFNLIQG